MGIKPGQGTFIEGTEGEFLLSLKDLLQIIRRQRWAILLVALVCVGATMGLSMVQTPTYEASIKILIGQEQGSNPSANLGGDLQGLQQLTQTMAEAVNARPVAEAVIRQLNLQVSSEDFLESYLSVKQVKNTQLIQVSYRDADPQTARQIANTIGDVFSQQVSEASASANAVTATVWERADVPNTPVSSNLILNFGLALVIGLMLGVGLALLLEYLDDSWRSAEEAEQFTGVPTFGVIPRFEKLTAKAKKDKQKG